MHCKVRKANKIIGLVLVILLVSLNLIVFKARENINKYERYKDYKDVDITLDIDEIQKRNKELNIIKEEKDEEIKDENALETVEIEETLDNSIIYSIEDEPTYKFTDVNKKRFTNTSVELKVGPDKSFNTDNKIKINTELNVKQELDNGWSLVELDNRNLYCLTKQLSDNKTEIFQTIPFNEATSVMKFEGNVSNECRNKAISLYNKIPANVIQAFKDYGYTMIVTTDPTLTQGHCGMHYPIEFNYPYIGVYAKSVGAVDIAVLHETGHLIGNVLAYKEGWGTGSSSGNRDVASDPVWGDIYREEVGKSGFKSYVTWCQEEYFAECVWKALTSPSWMQRTLPRSYNYVIDCIRRI